MDIDRTEKVYDHETGRPFDIAARVWDDGNHKTGELKIKKCVPPEKGMAQRCEFDGGMGDIIVLTPIFKEAKHPFPMRDYVQIQIVSVAKTC